MSQVVLRVLAVLLLPKKVLELLNYGRSIVVAMTNNAFFPSPVPTLSAVTAALDALESAETQVKNKMPGAVAVRNVKRAAVVSNLKALLAYVQLVADSLLSQAAAVIVSANMHVRHAPGHVKDGFQAKDGAISGTADLIARAAAKRASYMWQWSSDAKTWSTLPMTIQAKATVTGLTPGVTYSFRFKAATKAGETDWSQVVTLMVR